MLQGNGVVVQFGFLSVKPEGALKVLNTDFDANLGFFFLFVVMLYLNKYFLSFLALSDLTIVYKPNQ